MPYGRVELPPHLMEQLEMAKYVGPLFHPMHKAVRLDHRPDLCPNQLGFEQEQVILPPPSSLSKDGVFRKWGRLQNEWKKRKQRLMTVAGNS